MELHSRPTELVFVEVELRNLYFQKLAQWIWMHTGLVTNSPSVLHFLM